MVTILKKVMGVDYGSRRIALSMPWRQPNGTTHIKSMVKKFPKCDDPLRDNTLEMVCFDIAWALWEWTPDLIAVEYPIQGRSLNVQTTIRMSMMAGAIMSVSDTPKVLITPSEWKKITVGRGNATKSEVSEWLSQQLTAAWRDTNGDQDLVDATCIALAAERIYEARLDG